MKKVHVLLVIEIKTFHLFPVNCQPSSCKWSTFFPQIVRPLSCKLLTFFLQMVNFYNA